MITIEKLKIMGANNSNIKFFENNFPNGIDLKKLKITGDYRHFFSWLKQELKLKNEYDNNGNIIKRVHSNGDIYEYKYDQNNNLIEKVYPDGDIYKYEYDQNSNLIKKVYPSENIYKYEYDKNNNLIKETYPNGNICEYKYDQNNNLIKEVFSDGDIYEYEYEYEYDQNNNPIKMIPPDGNIYECVFKYDKNDRLIQANGLTIEYLDDFSKGGNKKAEAAEAYIKTHQKISKKEMLERIEELEKKVESLEISSILHECKDVTDAKKLKNILEQDILMLINEYEDKTGLKVDKIDLKTGPFIALNLLQEQRSIDKSREIKRNHHVKVTVNL